MTDVRAAARDRYAALVADAADPPLAEAAATIALTAYPDLDPARTVAEIEGLAERAAAAAGPDLPARTALDRLLFEELGFRGNVDDYYDPRNSFLCDVLSRRTGIPITLAVLYLCVGRRVGLDLEGVGFPGHFLVALRERGRPTQYLDVFAGGVALDEARLSERLERAAGRRVALEARFLRAVSTREILLRMLANLRGIYAGRGDEERLLEILEWMVRTAPEDPELRRDRGLAYGRLGCLPAAHRDLTDYLAARPTARDREPVARTLREIERGGAGNLVAH